MTATNNGAAEDFMSEMPAGLSDNAIEDELLKKFLPPDAERSSEQEKEKQERTAPEEDNDATEKPDEDEDTSAEKPEGDEDEEGDKEESEGDKKFADEEGTYVKIKVGDEEHEVPVSELKRLYGQEASLTKKSMEVADLRKNAQSELEKATAGSAALLDRARARFEPYSKIDFHLAAKELSAEEYTALRNEALAAYEDVQFLEKHVGGLVQELQNKQTQDMVAVAKKSLEVLSGPVEKGGIEGWNEKLYDEIRDFATKNGAPNDVVDKLVDDWAIRLLHKAMLYERGQAMSSKKADVKITKVNKTPKKVVKTSVASKVSDGSNPAADNRDKALKKLRATGSDEAAMEAILAGWNVSNQE